MNDQDIKAVVKDRYGKIARGEQTFCCLTCGPTTADQCLAVGYTAEDLRLVPEPAILGVGCGHPTALVDLQSGETVLDLGSGAGLDVFLAARRMGKRGLVIGVDITEEMVSIGRQLADQHGFDNVEFRLGEIEQLPVPSETIDVVISNCVINLTPDKLASFKEIHRVLKPGGRFLIADLVTTEELPKEVRASAAAWADCLAGAMEKEAYLETIRCAGFSQVEVLVEKPYEFPGTEDGPWGKIRSVQVRTVKRR